MLLAVAIGVSSFGALNSALAMTTPDLGNHPIARPQAPVVLAVNRLPARSYGIMPTRKVYVCGGSSWGKNVCRPAQQLPLRYQ